MRRTLLQVGLAALLVGVAFGCQKQLVRKDKTPPDPLLVSKKPVEGRPHEEEEPPRSARVELPPPPPAGGGTVTVAAPGTPAALVGVKPAVPGEGR
jgi:hypothetical protein